jgi:hypothetical protein
MIFAPSFREVDIDVPTHWKDQVIIKAVEGACKDLVLIQRSRLYWVKHLVRWQIKMEKQKGTLEISFLPRTRRAWLTVRKNRYADWMDLIIPQLKMDIERRLTGPRSESRG